MSDTNNSCEAEIGSGKESIIELNNTPAMFESQELNESERDIMKGDTVGDTVYSARWIINTLKSLSLVSDESFSSDMETSYCMLWDMTADKDVALFLLELDFFQITDQVLRSTSNPRLTEIVLGIIGNLSCHNNALKRLEKEDELVSAIFHYLTCDDTETLLQVIRIFKCLMWDVQSNKLSYWRQKIHEFNFFGNSVSFILTNSKNELLLVTTLELMEHITAASCPEDRLLDKWFDLGLVMDSLFESFNQLFEIKIEPSEKNLAIVKNWLTIFQYIVNTETFKTSVRFEKEVVYSNATSILDQILKSFPLGFMIPLTDISVYCIGTSVEIMMWFLKNRGYYETDVIALVPTLLISLKTDFDASTIPKEDLTQESELLEYLEKSWDYILHSLDKRNLYTIKVMCENLLKSERQMYDDILKELIQALKINDDEGCS